MQKLWGVKYEVTCSKKYLITVYNRAYKDNKGEASFKEWLRLLKLSRKGTILGLRIQKVQQFPTG